MSDGCYLIEFLDWDFCMSADASRVKQPYWFKTDARMINKFGFQKVTMADLGLLYFLKSYQTLHQPFSSQLVVSRAALGQCVGTRRARVGQSLVRLMSGGFLSFQEVTSEIAENSQCRSGSGSRSKSYIGEERTSLLEPGCSGPLPLMAGPEPGEGLGDLKSLSELLERKRKEKGK